MNEELQEAKRKYITRDLGKCGKCKFNNYVMGENGYKYTSKEYCHVKEMKTVKLFFCRYFKKNR